jgi:hypothetical protein
MNHGETETQRKSNQNFVENLCNLVSLRSILEECSS